MERKHDNELWTEYIARRLSDEGFGRRSKEYSERAIYREIGITPELMIGLKRFINLTDLDNVRLYSDLENALIEEIGEYVNGEIQLGFRFSWHNLKKEEPHVIEGPEISQSNQKCRFLKGCNYDAYEVIDYFVERAKSASDKK